MKCLLSNLSICHKLVEAQVNTGDNELMKFLCIQNKVKRVYRNQAELSLRHHRDNKLFDDGVVLCMCNEPSSFNIFTITV